ncbi:hypothetical protein BN1723_008978 [Verticillium longisporum]|uniref:Band 7 domain-containing protein n=1 Tax=Verticillium longisporum TaxID=100787 RepID=A0A0G4KKL3_VERLO|nr:hypothetical protein BN1723_008978 [Verticillium longisporum]
MSMRPPEIPGDTLLWLSAADPSEPRVDYWGNLEWQGWSRCNEGGSFRYSVSLRPRSRTQTTLRHVIGARILQDVIERREEIAQSIGEIIEDVAAGWGVQVESMLIKDIIFSQELQESLSMAAQSKRIGESKIIAAKAEVEAAKLMRQAADILSSAPAMQIRYLEAMQAMAKSANSKVIFLPGASQGMPSLNNTHITDGNGESSSKNDITGSDFGGGNPGFQQALNSRRGPIPDFDALHSSPGICPRHCDLA